MLIHRASSKGIHLHGLEQDSLRIGSAETSEVNLNNHPRKHFAQDLGSPPQIQDLLFPQIESETSDLKGLVPGTILVGDGNDPGGSVRLYESFEPSTEKIEILWYEIEQAQGFNSTRHSEKVRARSGLEMDTRKLLEMVIPATVDAGDERRARTVGIPW